MGEKKHDDNFCNFVNSHPLLARDPSVESASPTEINGATLVFSNTLLHEKNTKWVELMETIAHFAPTLPTLIHSMNCPLCPLDKSLEQN
jgi:hypothetical protein